MTLGLLVWMAAFVTAGYVFRQFRAANGAESVVVSEHPTTAKPATRSGLAVRVLQIAPIVILAVVVWTESRNRALDEDHGDIALLWVLMMALSVAIADWPVRPPSLARFVAWAQTYKLEIAAVAVLTIGALCARVFELDTHSWIYSGDEGSFGLAARDVLEGRFKNPFMTMIQAHPTFGSFLQAGVMRVFGDDVTGSRMLSAIVGAATIPFLYLYCRRHFGVATALTASVILAAFHLHLFWSRDAQNNIFAAFFIVVVLWLLDRAVDSGRPVDALITGLVIGIAQLFYVSNRLLIPFAAIYLGYALVAARLTNPGTFNQSARRLVKSALVIAAGIVLGFLPLAAYYVEYPDQYSARIRIVSIFQSGWLDLEKQLSGKSTLEVLWMNFKQAAMIPFHTTPAPTFYHPPPPLVGWPLVIPIAIGLVLATVGFWQRKYFGLVVFYWMTVAGMALTVGPNEVSRFAGAVSLLPVFAAIGLVTVARFATARLRLPKPIAAVAVAAAVAAIALWNVNFYFHDSTPVSRHSDFNTRVADTFAYELEDLGPDWMVFYAAAPRMYYAGHPSLPFIAKGNIGVDVTEQWNPYAPPPELSGPTVFFFLPERRAELAVIEGWFPGGETIDRTLSDGTPLYTEYRYIPEGEAG